MSQPRDNIHSMISHLNSYEDSFQQEELPDLSLFANTQFFDFESGQSTNIKVDDLISQQERLVKETHGTSGNNHSSQDGFNNGEFGAFQLDLNAPISSNSNNNSNNNNTTAQPKHILPALEPAQKKRRTESVSSSPQSKEPDTPSDVTPEEDKRRRNTAASARFRAKKKQREQDMERHTKELQDKVNTLETKITQLEMENKWLRNLVVEKNEARDTQALLSLKREALSDSTIHK